MSNCLMGMLMFLAYSSFAQDNPLDQKEIKAAREYLSDAQKSMADEKFVEAEADYRQAISLNPKSEVARYNLGTAYYGKEKNAEAMFRFKQAATTATTKTEKHKAFHNLGNTFMNEKNYQQAVAAYKDALRNNPNDDETRYNLALAKEMLEKNPPPPEDKDDKDKDNQDKKDQNKDQKEQQDRDNQDKKEGDEGDKKEDKDKGEQKEDKQKGDEDKKEEDQPDKPKEEKGDKPQQQQQVPGQLSPQQVKSLLEAMNNEEKKVQDKINAENQKGVKVKSDKDW